MLLLFLLVLVLLSAGQLLRRLNEQATTAYAADRLARSGAALAEAKRALLGAAVAYGAGASPELGPGRISCAAGDTDLVADGAPLCIQGGAVRSTGFFPSTQDGATTQPLPYLLDASNSPLVYVMDNRFRKASNAPIHLGITPSLSLTLDGQPVVALLFAPGEALNGQARPDGPFDIQQYLEDPANTDGDGAYVTPSSLVGNDMVVAITHQDVLCAIRPRVRAARLMQEAFDADSVTNPPPPAWYANEGWHSDNGSGVTRGAELETLTCVSSAL